MGTQRLVAIFSGAVHGVGFRFTANSLARQYPVTGYVRNLNTGDVEVVAEGETEDVRNFIEAVKRAMKMYIGNVEENWSDASGGFSGFGISH